MRDFKEGDAENEITLLNANVVQPHDFSDKYYEVKGNSLLWLSDLHFGNSGFVLKSEIGRYTLAELIKECCKNHGRDIEKDVGGLIITGDITNCANKEGFAFAKSFIKDWNREALEKLESENIIFCPGNHDFKRKDEELENEAEYISRDEYSEYFTDFYKDIYNIRPNEYFASGRKILFGGGKTVEIASLNSCRLQQYKNFEGHGYISKEQLEYVEKQMKWDKENSETVRIVIMHHHYLPACLEEKIEVGKASSVLYDADRLMQWLVNNNVKLLLHGHKHNSFISKVSYPKNTKKNCIDSSDLHDIFIVGMGGTGIIGVENEFATITFEKANINLNFYKIHSDNIERSSFEQNIKISIE